MLTSLVMLAGLSAPASASELARDASGRGDAVSETAAPSPIGWVIILGSFGLLGVSMRAQRPVRSSIRAARSRPQVEPAVARDPDEAAGSPPAHRRADVHPARPNESGFNRLPMDIER